VKKKKKKKSKILRKYAVPFLVLSFRAICRRDGHRKKTTTVSLTVGQILLVPDKPRGISCQPPKHTIIPNLSKMH